jgi:hypothetical protein
MEPLFKMWNSNQESEKKPVRLAQLHEAKRKLVRDGESLRSIVERYQLTDS